MGSEQLSRKLPDRCLQESAAGLIAHALQVEIDWARANEVGQLGCLHFD